MIFIARIGISVTAAVAIMCSVAACSSSGSQQKAVGSATFSSASTGPATSASQSTAGGSTTGQSVAHPGTALSTFLTNVVKGNFVGACNVTAELTNGGTLSPSAAGNCAAASTNAQVKAMFVTIQKAVTPAGADTAAPIVAVNGVSAAGESVTVMPNQITIDNQSLQGILSANHGSGAAITSFQVTKIGNLWYVVSFL